MSDQEIRPLKAVKDTDDLPRAAVHSLTCLCGCALATYSMQDTPRPVPELRRRAA